MTDIPFPEMPKIPRLSRDCVITEKIDGTNANIYITDDGQFLTGSRTKWITPGKQTDNYGFSRWAHEYRADLMKLGPGHHFGEWWGLGIQRGYGLTEKRFSLFATHRWSDPAVRPACCSVVPVLYYGIFSTEVIWRIIDDLAAVGSVAAPGFGQPEGVVIYHEASKQLFKKTIEKDDKPKGSRE